MGMIYLGAEGGWTAQFRNNQMLHSMTGFAQAEQQLAEGVLSWELRSINHRYLEVQLRLPEGWRSLEPKFREIVGQRLARGKVDGTLSFRLATNAPQALQLNLDLARQLIGHSKNIAEHMLKPAAVSPLDVLGWPGVLRELAIDSDTIVESAAPLLADAIDDLCETRGREGKRICIGLEQRLTQITSLVVAMRARMPEILQQIRSRMQERAQSLEVRLEPERLEQEMLLLAQKSDIDEELDRLDAHVAEITDAMAAGSPAGRRLDFLMQELNREANTLASKAADAETTRQAVDLKVLIEQMREQIQNVE